jgi:plasmid stabilization system protein ParE
MYSVHITKAAEEDIISAVNYIADVLNAPVAANRLLDEIEKYEKILAGTPKMYPFVSDKHLSEKRVKFIMLKKYMMFYVINEENKKVTVVRFLHGRRDWKNILTNELKV